jgi:hypothetical protein
VGGDDGSGSRCGREHERQRHDDCHAGQRGAVTQSAAALPDGSARPADTIKKAARVVRSWRTDAHYVTTIHEGVSFSAG